MFQKSKLLFIVSWLAFLPLMSLAAMSDGEYAIDGEVSALGGDGVLTDGEYELVVGSFFSWQDGELEQDPDEVCDGDNLELCTSRVDCENADGYWYSRQCHDEPSRSGGLILPPSPMINTISANGINLSFNGNHQAEFKTTNRQLYFELKIENAQLMAISEREDFSGGSFLEYRPIISWTMGSERETVYFKFRSAAGGLTEVFQVSLIYEAPSIAEAPKPLLKTENKPASIVTPVYVFKSFLTIGSTGEEVRQLQLLLKSLGYYDYPTITGYFGPATAAAVKKFQVANGLEPVGYVGPGTRAALNEDRSEKVLAPVAVKTPEISRYVFKSFLTIGSTGEEVRQLQLLLKSLGYYDYPTITGYFGPATAVAVKKFQAANGLEPVGYVGPGTRAVLNK